jgi:predicted LPLAT superfamily acyltransferase
MVMFPDNARKIHGVLQAVAPDFKLAVIAIGNARSTLAIRDCAGRRRPGGPAGRPHAGRRGRRVPAWRPSPSWACRRGFPTARCAWPCCCAGKVIFMVGLYLGGKRYDVRFETDGRLHPAARRPGRARTPAACRVARLRGAAGSLCREAPYNWFNFYDYWREETLH